MRTCLFLVFTACCAPSANAQSSNRVHTLMGRGRTMVEAEDYSATSKDFPYAVEHLDKSAPVTTAKAARVPCPCNSAFCKISGKKHVGFFWANSWFEMNVEVKRLARYHLSLRTASPDGTTINIQAIDSQGNDGFLASVDVPKTGSWSDYKRTPDIEIPLLPGKHTLRFVNANEGHGANIDYLVFTADASDVRPKKNTGPDINPLKGFSSGWWRKDDYASVGFQYIEWKTLEPRDDFFDWDAVEQILNRPGSRGKHIILQFVVDWDHDKPLDKNYRGPEWLLKRVGEHRGTADPKNPDSRPMRVTRYDNPVFLAEAKEAIKAITDRYRDDPRIFVMQTGLLGFWGEWHTFPREDWTPSKKTKEAILGAYLEGIGPNGLTHVRYPDEPVNKPQRRMGYTNGSAVPTPHGYEFGKAIAKRSLWKNGPVHGEWPPNVEQKYWRRFFATDEGSRFIQQGRYSTLQPPEHKEIRQKLSDWSPDGRFMQMHRLMGYNFEVRAVRQLTDVDKASKVRVEIELANSGIAPFYKDWTVQLAVLTAKNHEVVGSVIDVDIDLRRIGPGQSTVFSGLLSGKLSQADRYQLGLRILQPGADTKKSEPWPLDARNTYVVVANDVDVVQGTWNKDNTLIGGWNILDDIGSSTVVAPERLDIESRRRFPFEGSFRPSGN